MIGPESNTTPRRAILRAFGMAGVASVAGCNANDDDDLLDREEVNDDVPEEPVKVDAQFSKSPTGADVRAVLTIVSIPPDGRFGTVGFGFAFYNPGGDFSVHGDELHHIESVGFNESEPGVWSWDGEHDKPTLTLDIDIQMGDLGNSGFGTHNRAVIGSNYHHIEVFMRDFISRYHVTHPDYEGLSLSIENQFEITPQRPGFIDSGGGLALFGPHEYVHLVHDEFESYLVGRRDSLPPDPKSHVKKINEFKHMFQLGGNINRTYGWNVELADSSGTTLTSNLSDLGGDGVGAFITNGSPHTSLHEYVHLEQQFELSSDMEWFREASADYFARLYSLYTGSLEFNGFYSRQSDFSTDQPLSSLTNPQHPLAYAAESLLAALDAKIRENSGDTTLTSVFRVMNDHDSPIDLDAFKNMVRDAAGQSLDQWLERNVTQLAQTTIPESEELFVDRNRFNIKDSENITYESVDWHIETE